METEVFLDWLEKVWDWLKGFVKHTLSNNFDTWDDFVFFLVLFGFFAISLFTFTAGAYWHGYDQGETAGLKKGFASGTTYGDCR